MQFVRKQMKEQHYEPSYVSALYEKADGNFSAEDEHVFKFSAASLYTGGADTVKPLEPPLLFQSANVFIAVGQFHGHFLPGHDAVSPSAA